MGPRRNRHTHASSNRIERRRLSQLPHTEHHLRLLKATRSHTISSPSIAETLEAGRPNACNLCHLDRSLSWTEGYLANWYDQPQYTLDEQRKTIPTAALGALTGDAGKRAIYYWHMGWQAARETSGTDWLVPYLPEGLTDSYDAVRYIAARSLQAPADYDFIAPAKEQRAIRDRIVKSWSAGHEFDAEAFHKLRTGRNDPPVKLGE